MALSDEELDQLIHGHIKSELNEIKLPNIDEQWDKVRNVLLEESISKIPSKKLFTLKRLTWVAALLIIAGAFSFIHPSNANAFGERIVEFFNYVVGKTTQNKTESYKQPGEPKLSLVENMGGNIEKEINLEEAEKIVSNKLAQPKYLPSGAMLKRVVLMDLGPDIHRIIMEYDFNNTIIIFSQVNSGTGSSKGSMYDTDDTQAKDLSINGSPASLYISKNGMAILNWQSRGLVLQLTGKVTEEEIIKIANSVL